jgi:hypothetical protein
VLKVNEEGSEATVATAAMMVVRVSAPLILEFFADHAFILFIIDNRAEAILFMGRVTGPPALAAEPVRGIGTADFGKSLMGPKLDMRNSAVCMMM